MYTPEDGTRTDLVTDDRPYAGLLYAGVAWNRRLRPTDASYEVLDVRELTLGVIGPWSLARESQDLVHDVRRSEEHTSELQSLMRISYAVFCLKKKKTTKP